MFWTILRETLRGKSIGRTLQNIRLSTITVSGSGIDLGAKSKQSSYFRFLKLAPGTHVTFGDLNPQDPGMLKIDLERDLPIPDRSQDFVLSVNCLNLIYNYPLKFREMARILKKDGKLVGGTTFLSALADEPVDYFRFSGEALMRIMKEAGFREVEVSPVGAGPFTAGYSIFAHVLKFNVIRLPISLLCIGLDWVLRILFPKRQDVLTRNFPIGYVFTATV